MESRLNRLIISLVLILFSKYLYSQPINTYIPKCEIERLIKDFFCSDGLTDSLSFYNKFFDDNQTIRSVNLHPWSYDKENQIILKFNIAIIEISSIFNSKNYLTFVIVDRNFKVTDLKRICVFDSSLEYNKFLSYYSYFIQEPMIWIYFLDTTKEGKMNGPLKQRTIIRNEYYKITESGKLYRK